jgi:t-SNARE complex subunit (syntaxin)
MADASANWLAIIIIIVIVIVIVVIVCTGNPDRVEKTGTRPYRTEAKTDCQP